MCDLSGSYKEAGVETSGEESGKEDLDDKDGDGMEGVGE